MWWERLRSAWRLRTILALLVGLLVFTACDDPNLTNSGEFSVTVVVDANTYVYRYDELISVGQFLEEVDVVLGPDDEVNPLRQTQLRDGMRITVTRVRYEEECEYEGLPYDTETRFSQSLEPGETKLYQTGEDGTLQVCYRITYKDGEQTSRDKISELVYDEPRNEIVFVGSERPDTFIPIEGTLAYISSGQAWIIEGNTSNARPLNASGLDGRVFDLSADGQRLLYTRQTAEDTDPEFANELWAVMDITARAPQPVRLIPDDVRAAQWVPDQRTPTVSYSTATPLADGGWQALNDLYLLELAPDTGETLDASPVIGPNSLGTRAYWGRRLEWSPDGTQLAWANADGVGLVDLDAQEFTTLANFPEYRPLLTRFRGAAVWVPTLSWSEDGYLLTTVHGPPYTDEAPEDSIIFDLSVFHIDSGLQIPALIERSGIWSAAVYSPAIEGAGGDEYLIAFFRARDPLNSPGTEYDLWVVDRDGSNARVLFPGPDQIGFRSPDPEDSIAWSPEARQIAVIYQGNLWIIDVRTGQATPITSDEQASRPRWSRQ